MSKTPLESLADVEAFLDATEYHEWPAPGTIRRLPHPTEDDPRREVRLTVADLRAVIAIAKLATGLGVPTADYPSVWAELTGYVQAADEDDETINAADLLAYMQELRAKAQAPVREWTASVTAGAER